MSIELPSEKHIVTSDDPGLTIIYGPPKCGKTTLMSTLPNNLILDLEEGTKYIPAMSVSIIGWAPFKAETKEEKEERLANKKYYIVEIGQEIITQGKPYQFITVDTATELEDMILPLATQLYKKTPMGANYEGNDVRELPRGAGYLYLRMAYKDCISRIRKMAPNIILLGHLKDTFLEKAGKEVQARELDLTGKIKTITCAAADAIGYLYWGEDSSLMLNFKSSDELLCGSRCSHLRGREIKIATFDKESNELKNIAWNLIFPNTFKTEIND